MNEFGSIVERHRRELLVHCYCMLGSLPDAEDAVQETLLCAWRYRDSLKEGAPLRPGLYSVATNTCLDAIGRDEGWAGEPDDVVWLGPTPDSVLEPLIPPARTPETITLMRETIEIALLRLTTCGSLELSSHPARKEALDRSRALGLWLRNWLPQACSSAKSSWKACLPASGIEAHERIRTCLATFYATPAAVNLLIIAPASLGKVFLDAAGTRWTISDIVWASYFFSLNEGLAGSALSSVP